MNLCTWYRQQLYFITVLLIIILQSFSAKVFAQLDTVNINLQQAEKLFLENNLSLLAARYVTVNTSLLQCWFAVGELMVTVGLVVSGIKTVRTALELVTLPKGLPTMTE